MTENSPDASPHLRLAVLGSGFGSNLDAIIDAIQKGELNAEVAVVVSDVPHARILDLARAEGIPSHGIDPGERRAFLSETAQAEIVDLLQTAEVDLVILAGFMRIIQRPVLEAYVDRILNVHPSLLPKFQGKDAWVQALEAGEEMTGCTVHLVDEGVDTGKILAQAEVPILKGDEPAALHARIQEQEHRLLPATIGVYGRQILEVHR